MSAISPSISFTCWSILLSEYVKDTLYPAFSNSFSKYEPSLFHLSSDFVGIEIPILFPFASVFCEPLSAFELSVCDCASFDGSGPFPSVHAANDTAIIPANTKAHNFFNFITSSLTFQNDINHFYYYPNNILFTTLSRYSCLPESGSSGFFNLAAYSAHSTNVTALFLIFSPIPEL